MNRSERKFTQYNNKGYLKNNNVTLATSYCTFTFTITATTAAVKPEWFDCIHVCGNPLQKLKIFEITITYNQYINHSEYLSSTLKKYIQIISFRQFSMPSKLSILHGEVKSYCYPESCRLQKVRSSERG